MHLLQHEVSYLESLAKILHLQPHRCILLCGQLDLLRQLGALLLRLVTQIAANTQTHRDCSSNLPDCNRTWEICSCHLLRCIQFDGL